MNSNFFLMLITCVLCILFYILNIPKLRCAQPITNQLYTRLLHTIPTLQTGDVILVRKRFPQDFTDNILYYYFQGHAVMCIRINNTVYGLDLINKKTDFPSNRTHIKFMNSTQTMRIFRLEEYIRETLHTYNSEITLYTSKQKVSSHDLQQRNCRMFCFLHYAQHMNIQYAPTYHQLCYFMYDQLCIPFLPITYLNCTQFISLAYAYIYDTPIKLAFYGVKLQYILEQHMHKTVF